MTNWPAVEAVGVCIAALAALINAAFFVYYLRLTRGIHRAAVEQARAAAEQIEALCKPVVVMASTTTLPVDLADWLYDVISAELEEGYPKLVNVGNGPALNLKWSYERVPDRVVRGECASLRPERKFTFQFPVERGGGEKKVECEYESAAGIRYRSTTTLDARKIVRSKIEVIGRGAGSAV